MRILVIEDDQDIGRLVRVAFERDGQDVVHAKTATEGLEMVKEWSPDVVLLDIGLPDLTGFDVTKKIRESSDVPIVIVSARAMEEDRIAGLDLGADDYIVKPFSVSELAARVRAVTRRTKGDVKQPSSGLLSHRDLVLDPDEYTARRGDVELGLTKTEFELLRMLMQKPGKLVTRSAITNAIWGRTASAAKNLLDVHMSSLRKKVDTKGLPAYIETVRGEGFRLTD